ncbi:MAG TPA: ABC transporter substrate-binding protein [Verrucomicrobiae bacterium]|jgi:ABC-type nitrate/sulfonate/bicarbonate transport system substrate-binding protein|nr:ABC transporter substrate-binding protein [Verrucomicrobiae bacterium]
MRFILRFMIAALFYAASIADAGAAERIALRYGQNAASAGSLSSLPLTVAERKGFFVREGIDLVVVPIPGGTDRIVAALDKGEVDAGRNATPYLIQAVLKGSPSVAIAAQTLNPVYSLIVRSEIKSYADLKGKVVGLSTPGDTITLSTLRLLAHHGIKPADFHTKAVVGTSARFDCLKAGECAAVPMGQPDDIAAIKEGYRRLGFNYEAGADLIFNVDMTRREWGEKNQDALVRFVRAFAAAYQFINDAKNRPDVENIIAGSLKTSPEIAGEIFAPYHEPGKNVLPKKGEIDLQAFNRVLALMSEAGVIPTPAPPAERFIDLRYLKAAGIQ